MSRKSLGGRAVLLEENDDAFERKARRKTLLFEQDSSEGTGAVEAKGSKRKDKGAKLVNYDFSSIINMCSANKVNTKNTWSLDLIDHIDDVLELQEGSFQKASCTLQASVQIYEKRVDSTHQDTFKMLENVNRTRIGDAEQNRENRRKGNRLQVSNFLESNLSNITNRKIDREYEVDPLFRKMSKNFDAGGARGLLVNHLGVHQGPNLVFDTSETFAFSHKQKEKKGEDENPAEDFEKELEDLPTLPASNTAPLCPSLEVLRRTMEESTMEHESVSERTEDTAHGEPSSFETGENDDFDYEDECAGFVMDDEDDFSVCEDSESVRSGPVDEKQGSKSTLHESLVRGEVDFTQFDAYSFFKAEEVLVDTRKSEWAGPSHWKFVRKPSSSAESDATKSNKAANRRSKKAAFFEFSEETLSHPVELTFPKSLSSINLAKRSINTSSKTNNLPEDLHYSIRDLCKLFLKPVVISEVMRKGNRRCSAESSTLLTRGVVYDDDADDDHAAGYFESFEDEEGDAGSVGDWVAPSHQVEKIEIDYAKTAKRVDVKQLKSTLWEEITREKRPQQGEQDVGDTERQEEGDGDEVEKGLSFTECVRTIAPRLGDERITVPFYFICLLHLANENNLEFEGSGDLADFVIHGN